MKFNDVSNYASFVVAWVAGTVVSYSYSCVCHTHNNKQTINLGIGKFLTLKFLDGNNDFSRDSQNTLPKTFGGIFG